MKIKFIRKIDELGRIVIPKDLRRILDIKPCEELEISVTEGGVIIRKSEEKENDD